MNPSVLGGGAALLVALAWLLTRRKPVVVLRSTDASAVAALNRAQITQVQVVAAEEEEEEVLASTDNPLAAFEFPAAGDARGRAALVQELSLQLQGPTPERLGAITRAAGWGDRAALPLLQRGLRDVDPEVVLAASTGMAKFRGRTPGQAAVAKSNPVPLPRNAAALT